MERGQVLADGPLATFRPQLAPRRIRCRSRLDVAHVRGWEGVIDARREGDHLQLEGDPSALLQRQGGGLLEIPKGDQAANWRQWGRNYQKDVFPETEAGRQAQSPAFNVDRIKADLMLVHGAKDPAIPLDWARDAAGWLAQARLEVLPGLGHLAHEEAPDKAAAQIAAFLKEHA